MQYFKLLLIDPDTALLDILGARLQQAGYRCGYAHSASSALELVKSLQPHLVLAEVDVLGASKWELVAELRTRHNLPLIIHTSRADELDTLRGFQLGADDYIIKPCSVAEIVARIGAVLARRTGFWPSRQLISNDIVIDFDARSVSAHGALVALTPTEYRVLEILARRAQRPVATDELVSAVWGDTGVRNAEQLRHFIWRLRRKLEKDPNRPAHIVTLRGYGYRLE